MSEASRRELQPLDTELLHGRSLADWHRWLTTDQETGEPNGHLAAPCSRYGQTADECAWYASACEAIYLHVNGEDDAVEMTLEFFMGLAVNNHDGVEETLRSYWYAVPEVLKPYVELPDEGGASDG